MAVAMARISRKLFPTTTGINQTNCSGCPYDCPYDCFEFPDLYFPPPPPPDSHQTQALQPLMVVLIALSVGFFFAINFYIVVVKCCGSRNSAAEASQSGGGEGELLDRNQVDHPIWFITTVGLQQSIINSITVCKFKKGEGLIEGTECSVCLSEFQEDEMLRLLPKCSHAFHIGCVDTWLRSHTTCPLCRAHILTDLAARPPNLGSVNQSEANLGGIEETQMENEEINGEFVGENEGIGSVSGGSFENRGEVVDEQREVVVQVEEIVPKEGIFESDESIGNFGVEGNETLRNNLIDSSSESAECEGRSVKIAA